MKTVLLAGGFGTRLSEETKSKPKPMVQIGGKPILYHIMNFYAGHGHKDFVIALGYKAEIIKEYFLHFFSVNNDLSVDLGTGKTTIHNLNKVDWRIDLIDTGLHTQTGGRVKRLQDWIGNETFMFTYGDGLSNVDIDGLLKFHRSHGKIATLTAVRPPSRFGGLDLVNGMVNEFIEKPQTGDGWINGGYMVFEPQIFDYIPGDEYPLEREPMEQLVADGQLAAFEHQDFWMPMDTLREKQVLEDIWAKGNAPWNPCPELVIH